MGADVLPALQRSRDAWWGKKQFMQAVRSKHVGEAVGGPPAEHGARPQSNRPRLLTLARASVCLL
jgi:hypothetical protein